ncbi:M-phase inducer phosphatase-like isoform X2 [Oopsacas minuta]|uniref:protein-tyrosine-phosphatase n=1 Tax=Oopsacas minuta TaxID=111878 RepID=A0AAV7K7B3_9METZ|nr:M-phase inducer phosphatase-like isoform X2 [Oopsacas minuta]
MDNTLGSCNDSTLSIFDSTPRCMLFSVSDSFTLPSSNETSPPEQNNSEIKASTSTPTFANDSYSDIIKVRPPKTYTIVDHSAPVITSPSPKRSLQQSPHGLMKTQNRLVSSLPHKESPLVKNSISTLQSGHNSHHKATPTSLSHPKNISSSSSVSSLNSDDDLFFEQLTTFQNTLENSVTTRTSPGPKIADFDTLLTGKIISHKPSPSSKSNSPLKDPTNKFCLSTYQLGDHTISQPLTDCVVGNVCAQKECKTEFLKVNEVSSEKENSIARGVVSAITPTQIVPHWGGSGKTRPVQKRVTFENKMKEDIKTKTTSNFRNDNHTPTRPQTRWKKVRSAPSLPSPPSSDSAESLTINSRIWCPTACATNSTQNSPFNLQPKRVCRGGSTPPDFHVSPAVTQLVLRSNSSPANTSFNSNNSDELIGDNSESHLLPVIRGGTNPDLKTIEPITLVRVLAGEFSQHISNLIIVDARYPYEYKGGHINTALNIWTEQLMYEFFLKSTYIRISNLRHIVVFYCEFSTMRGPSQYRYLRNEDRKLNEATFPKLHYPELYVLNGGYAQFFSAAATSCSPCCYVKMLDEEYKQEMAKCQILKHQGSRRAVSATCRVARPSKSNCRRKQKFQ